MKQTNLSRQQKVLYEISEAYGTPLEQRTQKQKNLTDAGICNALWDMKQEKSGGKLCEAVYYDLHSDFLCYIRLDKSWQKANDQWRSDLASFLAAMTDREYNYTFKDWK